MSEMTLLFWQLIESKMGPIPNYLKNLLKLMGYESAISIKTIERNDIDSFQKYLTSADMRKRVPANAQMEDFFGVRWETPENAIILPGHIKLIEQIVEFVNLTLATKGYEYFTVKSKMNQQGRTLKCVKCFCLHIN